MAPVVFPKDGPARTASKTAEPLIYQVLSDQLDDEWVVIHSLHWLNYQVGRESKRFAPAGECDFLLLHPSMGAIVLEIKGGRWQYNGHEQCFELLRWRNGAWQVDACVDVLKQVKTNVVAVQRALHTITELYPRVGYALMFPECDTQGRDLPPGLFDQHSQQSLILDMSNLSDLGQSVLQVAEYWKKAFYYPDRRGYSSSEIGHDALQKIIGALCPVVGYDVRLVQQIKEDQQWLELRPEQALVLDKVLKQDRAIIEGPGGTGKTLLAMEVVRRAADTNP